MAVILRSEMQRSVDRGLSERAHIFIESHGTTRRKNAREENELVDQFLDLFELAAEIKGIPSDPVTVKHGRNGLLYLPETRRHTLVRSWLNINVNQVYKTFPQHHLHPLITMFVREVPRFHDYRYWLFTPGALTAQQMTEAVSLINHVLHDILIQLASVPSRTAAGTFIRSANKNYQSLTRYGEALLTHYGTLQVIRLDLGYRDRVTYSDRTARHITYEETNHHRQSLLTYLKRGFSEKPVGYAWKLEHGSLSAYRYHLLLFFRSDSSLTDIELGQEVGESWLRATEGKGAFFNWNVPDNGIQRPSTGKIMLLPKLANVLQYMTQLDRYIKLRVTDGGRTFDKGNMPKIK